jgi:dTMP kinase
VRGRFITIEGGEGAGKSTAQSFIAETLEAKGVSVVCTREPGGTPLAEAIRHTLLSVEGEPPVELAELLLVFAARAQHLAKVIEPALAQGKWVICDRFTDATFAYQGSARGLSDETISALERLVQGDRRPDAVVLMDLSPEVGMTRARARGDLDRFEREDVAFYDRVRAGYLGRAQANPSKYHIVDAAQPLEAVQSDLSQLIGRWTEDD